MQLPSLASCWLGRFDRERFRGALSAGPLCQDEDYYDGMSASELFNIYTSTIRETLDRLVPLHDIVSRFRPSTPWFDAECRSVKRGARLLERRYRRTKDPEDRLAWIHALREKHSFFMSKENSYWENAVKSNSSNPKKLRRSVSTILGEPAKQTATHSTFSAAEFLTFLEQKVETIRSDTAGSAPPIFTPTDCSFTSFTPCTQQFVRNLIGSAPSKSCELDPAPTFLIKEFLDTLLPFLTRLCNVSLREGRLPSIPDKCHRYSSAKETRFGSYRHEELSTNLKPLVHVKGRRENRCAAALTIS